MPSSNSFLKASPALPLLASTTCGGYSKRIHEESHTLIFYEKLITDLTDLTYAKYSRKYHK